MKRIALAIIAGLLPCLAAATDPISLGFISDLSYRGDYVMFQVSNGSANSCAPCPGDPGGMAAGGYCWIAESETAQLAILLSAHAQGRQLSGRVTGISSNCTVYQMTVQD